MRETTRVAGWRRRYTRRALWPAPLLAGVLLAGCSRTDTTTPGAEAPRIPFLAWPEKDEWPAQFTAAAPEVQEAYRFAVANQSVLQYFPCFCGCVMDGHGSNFDCYVSEQRQDGSVIIDPMSFG